jgi:hypothetical protein
LVAAIWIYSHSEEFEPLIPELDEYDTLREVGISVAFPWTLALFSSELPNADSASVPENLTLILPALFSLKTVVLSGSNQA